MTPQQVHRGPDGCSFGIPYADLARVMGMSGPTQVCCLCERELEEWEFVWTEDSPYRGQWLCRRCADEG